MTASTLSRLPLMAGSVAISGLGRAGLWTWHRYMRAPLASTGLMALVSLTAMAASNALYMQTMRHPAPYFGASAGIAAEPVPMPRTQTQTLAEPAQVLPPIANEQAAPETTGSVSSSVPVSQPLPNDPVGNAQAFQVQKKLTELGLFTGKVDGFYGPMTAQAIRSFEERNGLEPTGALTPAIVESILKADAAGRLSAPSSAQVMPPPQAVQVAEAAPATAQSVQTVNPVVSRLPALSPVDRAVDTVGNAAAETIDSIVAAVDGGREPPKIAQIAPPASLPALASAAQAPTIAPVRVASLENTLPQQQPATMGAESQADVQAPVNPANNAALVGQIQRGLASLGFYHGAIDGHPGDATARAIREFENFYRYKVTGEIKPDLVGLLRDAGATI